MRVSFSILMIVIAILLLLSAVTEKIKKLELRVTTLEQPLK
jgi:hypothetical protein